MVGIHHGDTRRKKKKISIMQILTYLCSYLDKTVTMGTFNNYLYLNFERLRSVPLAPQPISN